MLPHSPYRGNYSSQRDTRVPDGGICQTQLPSHWQGLLGHGKAPKGATSTVTATTAAGVSPLTPPLPSARAIDDRGVYEGAFPVCSLRTEGCMDEAWRLHQFCCTESLLRRIVELERENDFLRLALLEGSERRMRQRFCGGFGTDGSHHHHDGYSHFSESPAKPERQQQQQQILQRVKEVERSAKRYFQDELEKIRQEHAAYAAEAAQHATRGESYESTLAQSERRRWKEHVRHTVEELALLHREKEKQAAGAATTSTMAATAEATSLHHSQGKDDGGDADKRVSGLQREVEHWKREAERERTRARLYREQALRELHHMHAVYRHALGEDQSAFPAFEATPMMTGGIETSETLSHADQQNFVGMTAALPTVKNTTPTHIKEEGRKHNEESTQAARHDTPLHSSPPFSLRITSRSPVGAEKEGSTAAASTAGHTVGSTDMTAPLQVTPQTGSRRSYHSDMYRRRESATDDDGVGVPPSSAAQLAKSPKNSAGIEPVCHAFPFAQGGDPLAAGSAGEEADRRRRTSTTATTAGEKGESSLHGCGADALSMGVNYMFSAGASSIAPHASLDAWVDAFRVYISAAFVFPEEKVALSSMMEALVKYTQARLRTQQHFSECEACLHQLTQLQNCVVAAATGSVSSTLGNKTDTFAFQSLSNAVGSTSSVANVQRGRAKVDMDLAECRQTLQQVETFARTFQDLQRRRTRLLEIFEEEKQHSLLPLPPQRHSGALVPTTTAPVFQLHAALDDCMSQLYKQWDTRVTAMANSLLCRLNGTHSQESGGVCGSKQGGEFADSTHLITLLLRMCDDTLGRVETMRGRISRLGSVRIEEAESLEKLLANMDNYDPTAEEHMDRRKQIDAELEELRSWLTHIGQFRQRTVATRELLQQCLIGENRSTGGSERTSPRAYLHSEGGSAPSSLRQSLGDPTSLDEWRQALVMPDTVAAKNMDTNATNTTTAATVTAATPATNTINEHATPAFTLEDVTLTTGNEGPAIPTTSGEVKPEENVAEGNPVTFAVPGPPKGAATAEGNNKSAMAGDAWGGGLAELPPAHGAEDRHGDSGVPFRNSTNNKNDDDDDDDVTSSFHASAFDEDDRRGTAGRWHRRRKRSAARGYLGGIAAFAKAVVQRATQFSDTEYSSTSESERETEGIRRRRLER